MGCREARLMPGLKVAQSIRGGKFVAPRIRRTLNRHPIQIRQSLLLFVAQLETFSNAKRLQSFRVSVPQPLQKIEALDSFPQFKLVGEGNDWGEIAEVSHAALILF